MDGYIHSVTKATGVFGTASELWGGQDGQYPFEITLTRHDRRDFRNRHAAHILAINGNDPISRRDRLGKDARGPDTRYNCTT